MPHEVPDRYEIREVEGVRSLHCLEAPEVRVRVERGSTVTAAAAHKAEEGTIFLDGAAQGEPFLDLKRRVFNLDHHEGCVRPFTLATCEQAFVLVLRGLDVREHPWTVLANEPDLDAVMAIWVLLNGMHLAAEDGSVRRAVAPLLRLEGVIDAHGLDLKELAGLPEVTMAETLAHLDELIATERALKKSGEWESSDPLAYVADMLRAIDRLVYPPGYFEGFRRVTELAKVELGHNRVALVLRADRGVYEVEGELKRLYGKRLGALVLQKDARTYTLRQVDPFLPVDLEEAYEHLNMLDPAVRDPRSANAWGGSKEIGGSPRASGTALAPSEIAEALRQAFRKPTPWERLATVGKAFALGAAAMGAGWGVLLARRATGQDLAQLFASHRLDFISAVLVAAGLLYLLVARRQPRLFGVQLPAGRDWLLTLPVGVVAALLGGVWAPHVDGRALQAREPAELLLYLTFPLAAELVFRSLVHGLLLRSFRSQRVGGRWQLSLPVLLSAAFYALWTVPPYLPFAPAVLLHAPWSDRMRPLAALLFGLTAATARERSRSVLPPLVLHVLGVVAVVAAYVLVPG